MSGCFCTQGSEAPSRGEEVKESMCRILGVFNDAFCPVLGRERGQKSTNDRFAVYLHLSCFVAAPNQIVMAVQRMDSMTAV